MNVPVWVQAGIRSYDAALRLRWSPLAQAFVLERKIQRAEPGSYDNLMRTLEKRVGRLKDREIQLAQAIVEQPATQLERKIYHDTLARVVYGRMDAGARLDALKQGHLFLWLIPRPTANEPWSRRLECILYTLRENDIWAAGGADKFHDQMQLEEAADETRRRRGVAADLRSGAGEVFDDIQRKQGERILVGANLPADASLPPAGA